MKIYVVGSSKNWFLKPDDIREFFIVDQQHEKNNIDFLNPWYCELTGLYYLWKHVNDDIVGLEHYRNYFWGKSDKINKVEILEKLKNNDIICSSYAYPAWGKNSLYDELSSKAKDSLTIFLDLLNKTDKNLYNYFIKYLHGKKLWCCNTFIGPKKIINKWCEFIFPFLTAFEQLSPIGPNTNTYRREGYFTEFLFGAWLEYNKYKIIHCDMHKLDSSLTNTFFWTLGPTKQPSKNRYVYIKV